MTEGWAENRNGIPTTPLPPPGPSSPRTFSTYTDVYHQDLVIMTHIWILL
jgi:hypothetical protein